MNRDINEQARNAQRDVLYYATSDMVSLAVAASNSEVPQVAPPSPFGFMLWQGGISLPEVRQEKEILRAYGVRWDTTKDGNIVFTNILGQVLAAIGVKDFTDKGDLTTANLIAENTKENRLTKKVEQVTRACWALMLEQNVTQQSEPKPKPADRVSNKLSRQIHNVRLIDVKEHDEPETVTVNNDGTRKYAPYSHRFIVNGFFRNQPYGKNREQTKRIWIAPFIKGPKDKPLILKDEVRVWRR